MLTLLDRLFPYSGLRGESAEFETELHQIRWLRTKKALAGYSLILTYCVLVGCVGWLFFRDSSHTLEGTRNLLGSVLVAVVIAAVVTDLNVVRLAGAAHLPTMNVQLQVPQTDVPAHQSSLPLQSSHAADADKVKVLFALIQVRAWRSMAFEVAFRVTLVALLAVCFFNMVDWPLGSNLNDLGGPFARIYDLSRELVTSPGAWAILLGVLILGVQQVLEPIWRMRSLAARELMHADEPTASIGNLVLNWLIALFSYLIPGIFLVVILRNAQLTSVGLGLISFALIVCMGTWGVYDWLQQRAFQSLHPAPENSSDKGQFSPGQ